MDVLVLQRIVSLPDGRACGMVGVVGPSNPAPSRETGGNDHGAARLPVPETGPGRCLLSGVHYNVQRKSDAVNYGPFGFVGFTGLSEIGN